MGAKQHLKDNDAVDAGNGSMKPPLVNQPSSLAAGTDVTQTVNVNGEEEENVFNGEGYKSSINLDDDNDASKTEYKHSGGKDDRNSSRSADEGKLLVEPNGHSVQEQREFSEERNKRNVHNDEDGGHLTGDNSSLSPDSNRSTSHDHQVLTPAPAPEMNDNANEQGLQYLLVEHGRGPENGESISDWEGGVSGGDVNIPFNEAGISLISKQGQDPPLESEKKVSKLSKEVVKSIVYGGLKVSITSLSVVSNAAASRATTSKVMATGVANLLGGLFIFANNLRNLYANRTSEVDSKYEEALGERDGVLVHVIVAMLSYLVFGVIPLVVYGFTFSQTDDPDLKLLAVAVISFVCIILLATGKAYTLGAKNLKEYISTIQQYVTDASKSFCAAYAVSDLFKRVMDSLGWFNSSTTDDALLLLPNPNINKLTKLNSTWAASY